MTMNRIQKIKKSILENILAVLFFIILLYGETIIVTSRSGMNRFIGSGLYRINFFGSLIVIVIAYLCTDVFYLFIIILLRTVKQTDNGLLIQRFFSRSQRIVRMCLISILLLLSGINYYFEDYMPFAYAERIVNNSIKQENWSQIRRVSDSSSVYGKLRKCESVSVELQSFATKESKTYIAETRAKKPAGIEITLKREEIDQLGILVHYHLIEISNPR